MKIHSYFTLVVALALVGSSPALAAYIDPGTGSMIFQAVVAGVAAAALAIRTYWHRIKLLFNRSEPEQESPTAPDSSEN